MVQRNREIESRNEREEEGNMKRLRNDKEKAI
jgi:hypothetical protein